MSPSNATLPPHLVTYARQLRLPAADSHKGQNGKVLIIGGSELFHAASKWSLDVASKFVDMVFYASVPSNNELVQQAKSEFWNGIVIDRDHLESYVQEADCILIGPGMERDIPSTQEIVSQLLTGFPDKKWVVDAGALQEVVPEILPAGTIVTPHQMELERLLHKHYGADWKLSPTLTAFELQQAVSPLTTRGVAVVSKGVTDQMVVAGEVIEVPGGNGGMTKGGTGDVLAGLIAALYCTNSLEVAAVMGSLINKRAGELLYRTVGPFFNASDLVEAVPQAAWEVVQEANSI